MFCKLKNDYYMDFKKNMIFQIAESPDGAFRIKKFMVLKRKTFLVLYYIEQLGDIDKAIKKISLGSNGKDEIYKFVKGTLEKYKECFCFLEESCIEEKKEVGIEIESVLSDFQVINEEKKGYDVPKNIMIQITEKCSKYSEECINSRLCINGVQEISWELLEKIQRECVENKISTMILCGGETLEYANMEQLISRNNQLGVDTSIYTSLLVDKKIVARISKYQIKEMNLMLCKEELDNQSNFWENLEILTPSVQYINIHCSSENSNQLQFVLGKIDSNKLIKIYYYYKNIRDVVKVKDIFLVANTKGIEWFNESDCTSKSEFFQKPCSKSGVLNMSIDVNGQVVFCLLNHNEKGKTTFGDINNEALVDIWNRIENEKNRACFQKCINVNSLGRRSE